MPRNPTDPFDRIMRRLRINPETGCWECTLKPNTYGHVQVESRLNGRRDVPVAHRVVYERLKFPIPEGLVLDHLCEVRHCVRPGHMRPCTQGENIARAKTSVNSLNAAKTQCVNGHPLSGPNLYIAPDQTRACKTCRNDAAKRYISRKRIPV